jgi:hypothetical protein
LKLTKIKKFTFKTAQFSNKGKNFGSSFWYRMSDLFVSIYSFGLFLLRKVTRLEIT